MKSTLPKVMHKIADREMINLVLDTAGKLSASNISVVISKDLEKFSPQIKEGHPNLNIKFAIQDKQLGTAHAVGIGLKSLPEITEQILILYADTPLLKQETLKKMLGSLSKNSVCVLGFDCFEENKYGRLLVKGELLQKIIETKDASNDEKKITLCNSGVIGVKGSNIQDLISKVNNKNASGEYYLTDIVSIAKQQNLDCGFLKVSEREVLGVNSKLELAKAEKIKQKEISNNLMEQGVTILSPKSVYFSFDTKIDSDVIIHPNVVFGPGVEIKSGAQIKSFSHIEGAIIESGAIVGPFARIRPDTIIKKNARIGNFVEIKKSTISAGAKINHLSYIGDTEIGEKSNIGAGTITCNYDGYEKYRTKIGKEVFIGSNTALVAPIEVGDNAVIGAGSVITENISPNNMAISRSKQENIENGGTNYHNKRNQ
jgi:bifunctional UDP-N-acetylglucosamine pyrophosphorylase/glucosamine-1-phosphate N-acetyltransferase